MYRLLALAVVAVFALVGCSQDSSQERSPQNAPEEARAGEYGSDPHLDGLYDDCEAGDEAACEDLYLESPVDSGYEVFAIEQGGDDFGGDYPGGGTITAAPEPEEVSLGDTFTSQGFEWVITGVELQDERQESTDYGNSSVEGPWVVLEGEVTNTTDDYKTLDSYGLDLYTSQTSHNFGQSLGFTVDYEEDLFGSEVAPDYTKEGIATISMDSADEEPLYLEWVDPVSLEPHARLDLEGVL